MTEKHCVFSGRLFPAGSCGFRRIGSASTEGRTAVKISGRSGNRAGGILFSDAGRIIAENRNYLTDQPVRNAVHPLDGMCVLISGFGDLSAVQSPGVKRAGSVAMRRGRGLMEINAETGLARLQKERTYLQQQKSKKSCGLAAGDDRVTLGCADDGCKPSGSPTAEAGEQMQ